MSADLFSQLKNAALDLQASDYQSFERPLKTLGRLIRSAELADSNATVKSLAEYDDFISESDREGGMVGSHQLKWPTDPVACFGLTIELIERFADDPKFALNFCHEYFYTRSIVGGLHSFNRQVLLPFLRDYEVYVLANGDTATRLVKKGSNKVFIVHGHDEAALHGLARFVEKLGLEAIILKEKPNQGRTIIEKFEDAARDVGFAIVLFTPDDEAIHAGQSSQRARQNVVFELGYFSGVLGRGKVCLLRKGDVEIPSDLYGVIYTDMDGAEGWKQRLVMELKAAQMDFDANRLWV